MKKAKILVAVAALVAVGAAALASTAKIRLTFYKAAASNQPCSIPTTVTGTFVNQGAGTISASTHVSSLQLTTTCPTVTLYKGL
ncbi:hypothetical protein ACE38W_01920 [Chitinophaga sp. Hz27]|uniref:hypothetical protein n=1 Tax=Chitinophaga sp. Hz27 TaxID=3347169 RepID=UPI0035E08A8C